METTTESTKDSCMYKVQGRQCKKTGTETLLDTKFCKQHKRIMHKFRNWPLEFGARLYDPDPETSDNHDAAMNCGLRGPGTPLFQPSEMGFACPICGADYSEWDSGIAWSEYDMFIYCYNCNLDIPSCMCVKYPEPRLDNEKLPPRYRILRQIELFMQCMKDSKNIKQGIKMQDKTSRIVTSDKNHLKITETQPPSRGQGLGIPTTSAKKGINVKKYLNKNMLDRV